MIYEIRFCDHRESGDGPRHAEIQQQGHEYEVTGQLGESIGRYLVIPASKLITIENNTVNIDYSLIPEATELLESWHLQFVAGRDPNLQKPPINDNQSFIFAFDIDGMCVGIMVETIHKDLSIPLGKYLDRSNQFPACNDEQIASRAELSELLGGEMAHPARQASHVVANGGMSPFLRAYPDYVAATTEPGRTVAIILESRAGFVAELETEISDALEDVLTCPSFWREIHTLSTEDSINLSPALTKVRDLLARYKLTLRQKDAERLIPAIFTGDADSAHHQLLTIINKAVNLVSYYQQFGYNPVIHTDSEGKAHFVAYGNHPYNNMLCAMTIGVQAKELSWETAKELVLEPAYAYAPA